MTEENKVLNEEMKSEATEDNLKEAVENQLKKIRTQSLLLGAQTSCNVILQKIAAWESRPGKRTLNDHRRLIKDVKRFCQTGVTGKPNPDGTTSLSDEDNTKLTEEDNESNQ